MVPDGVSLGMLDGTSLGPDVEPSSSLKDGTPDVVPLWYLINKSERMKQKNAQGDEIITNKEKKWRKKGKISKQWMKKSEKIDKIIVKVD